MNKKLWINGCVAAGLLCAGAVAQACSDDAWSGSDGTVEVGGPGETPELPRNAGLCSMRTSGGYLQENTPADEDQMITRFYLFAQGTGSATIYRTFSDQPAVGAGGTEVYRIDYDGTAGEVSLTTSAGTVMASVNVNEWNSIEVDWEAGANADLWVNADATSAPASQTVGAGAAGVINSARIGAMGVTGDVTAGIDDYEARRSTAVGLLLLGDSENDGDVDIFDVLASISEIVDGIPVPGTPDVERDGDVDIFDVLAQIDIIVNP